MSRWRTFWLQFSKVFQTVVGVPDYERYVAHQKEHHPENEPLSQQQFFLEFLNKKYESGGPRCC